MVSTKFRTLQDIQSIVNNRVPEGVSLEYKASEIVAKRRIPALGKTAAAFANSAGGQFVIGVECEDNEPVRLDGGAPLPSQRDWIYQIVNSRTSPPLENFEVFEILNGSTAYYVIDVPVSAKAPHQFDHMYYKRRGPHSEPMEHYEIEDVRNRPKGDMRPLRLEISPLDEVLLLLTIRNDHPTDELTDLKFEFDANFNLDRKGIEGLAKRGLRGLHAASQISFHLDSATSILKDAPDAKLTAIAEYDFRGTRLKESFTLHIGDLLGSAIVRSDVIDAMQKLIQKVGDLAAEFARTRQENAPLLRMVDATGLRLSYRTLAALKDKRVQYDPADFGADGYRTLLEISDEEARKLAWIFSRRFGSRERADYEKLPQEVRSKFETIFRVDVTNTAR